jgi:hypothetical protein
LLNHARHARSDMPSKHSWYASTRGSGPLLYPRSVKYKRARKKTKFLSVINRKARKGRQDFLGFLGGLRGS